MQTVTLLLEVSEAQRQAIPKPTSDLCGPGLTQCNPRDHGPYCFRVFLARRTRAKFFFSALVNLRRLIIFLITHRRALAHGLRNRQLRANGDPVTFTLRLPIPIPSKYPARVCFLGGGSFTCGKLGAEKVRGQSVDITAKRPRLHPSDLGLFVPIKLVPGEGLEPTHP